MRPSEPVEPHGGLTGLLGRPLLLELRSPVERWQLTRSSLWHGRGLPPGRQRPILVIPGFLAGPRSVRSLRHVLKEAGWRAEVADVGRHTGPSYVAAEAAQADLLRLVAESAQPVTIVGHSRGGQLARVLAVRFPELVTQVIAMGSPLVVKYPRFAVVRIPAEVLERTYRSGALGEVTPELEELVHRDRAADFPAGTDLVSIYSRTDGIVDWRTSVEPAATCIEVVASHLGLVNSVPGLRAVAAALARQEE